LVPHGALSISPISPLAGETVKRGPLQLLVRVYLGSGVETAASVYARSDLILGDRIYLFDQGAHGDQESRDGIYGEQMFIGPFASAGPHELTYVATKENAASDERVMVLNVNPELSVLLQLQQNYSKGRSEYFSGRVADSNGIPQANATVNLAFSHGNKTMFSLAAVTAEDGTFNATQFFSFVLPDGTWNVSAYVRDQYWNEGNASAEISLSAPPDSAYYSMVFLSPVGGSIYSRAQSVPVTVQLTEGESAVENANVSFLSPQLETVFMEEVSPGTYSANYQLKLDEPLGAWDIGVQGFKTTDDGKMRAGWNTVQVRIGPTKLLPELTSPGRTDKLYANTTILLRMKATYPDGTPVRGGFGNLTVSNSRIQVKEVEAGTYQGSYFIPESAAGGVLTVRLEFSDSAGNTGSLGPISLSVEALPAPIAPTPFYQAYYETVLVPYWYVLALGALIATAVATPALHRMRMRALTQNLEGEIANVQKMEKEAQLNYYTKMNMSKQEYNALMNQYRQRLAKANERLSKIRKAK
jgi:hypothetical protein